MKQKFIKKMVNSSVTTLILAAFLANLAIPGVARAQVVESDGILSIISQSIAEKTVKFPITDVVLEESEHGRMFSPPVEIVKPDMRVNAVITAYTSTVDQTDDDPFVAAWGDRVYDGMIAANWLPHNTKIKIPSLFGDKIFTVDDRMNSRYGFGRLDIWMDASKASARKFGVQRVEVEVYYPKLENGKLVAIR